MEKAQTHPARFVFASIGIFLCGFTLALILLGSTAFQRFLGNWHPLAVLLGSLALGWLLLTNPLKRWNFLIVGSNWKQGLIAAIGLATALALLMGMLDVRVRLPEDLNVPFPESLLFYPTIAFIVEVAFHLLPLALLLLVFGQIGKSIDREKLVYLGLPFAALIEPAFQLGVTNDYVIPTWAYFFVLVHIAVINICQLLLFKRYDFLTMYVFRLTYYLWWHVVWGYFRLPILFN
ncbi:MAG: hypothetical protein MI746_08225 [Pseudomonadales bacterium]|nr:hypothetical protein [Pseudomonadales bacterium]